MLALIALPSPVDQHPHSQVFSMVDSSCISSPRVDPDDYSDLQDLIQSLGRNYRSGGMSFDESSSNFARQPGHPVIPDIHVPLQVDDRSSRDILYGRGDSPDEITELGRHGFEPEGDQNERTTTGSHASTSTSAGDPPNQPEANIGGAAQKPPRDVDLIPPPSTGLGPMPYTHFYDDGPGGFTATFRAKYDMPDDVLVERVTGERIPFGADFIVLPLYPITEGGVRFPMSPFLRYFMSSYNLAPIQLSLNTWHILCSAMRLAESNNLPFTLGDLMLMYIVSRNPSYDRYYMATRQHFDHLVDHLSDSEKWRNALVRVSGNFEWGPINPLLDHPFPTRVGAAVERPFNIPRARGYPGLGFVDKPDISLYFVDHIVLISFNCIVMTSFFLRADCSAPNKALYLTSKWDNLIALLQCANRDAPTLLGYTPTYGSFAQCRDKTKMVRKALDLSTIARQALQKQYAAQDLSTSNLPARQDPPEQVPTDRPVLEEQPPVTTNQSQRSRRRGRNQPAGEGEDHGTKKARVSENDVAFVGTGHATEGDTTGRTEPQEAFVPDLTCPDGHVITAGDSLSENPLLAMTLLKGVALPKDMKGLHSGKASNMAELCLFLAKAGQCASRAFSDMDVLLETKKTMRADLQAQRKEAEGALNKVIELEAKVADAAAVKEERDRLQLQVGLDYAEIPAADHRREPPVVPPMELPGPLPHTEQPNPIPSPPPKEVDDASAADQ
ncbi:hypothetical protein RHMOL_Rhmol07G0156800 [Rhododendron molle]|uniref:Uncharacterized protein n=1 Tax=Rhododendron molle TaxID=49168 RepID=A0ACC0N0Z3_RHOML|nr:hypothetical protein RHMOL_Rhmol07G0156800 [Rhododendron molle]